MEKSEYIEVTGTAIMTKPVEMHRATTGITVTTRKAKAGLEKALQLRTEVIEALKACGIPQEQIQDSGGSAGQSFWSSRKAIAHQLCIEHEDLEVLSNAMAAVEDVFANAREGYFSGISGDFTFQLQEPRFANTNDAHDEALKAAFGDAKHKASLLAEAASVRLASVSQIRELVGVRRQRDSPDLFEPDDEFDDDYRLRRFAGADDYGGHSPAQPRDYRKLVRVRVRFLTTTD